MTTAAPSLTPRRRRIGLSWVLVVSALEVLSLLLGAGPPFQPVLSIIFVATCPGFLLLELDHPADRVAKVILGIAASLSINMLIVTVALVGDRSWIVPAIVAAIAGLAFLPRYQLRAVIGNLGGTESAAGEASALPDEMEPTATATQQQPRPEPQPEPTVTPDSAGSASTPLPLDIAAEASPQAVLLDLNQASAEEIAGLPSVNGTLAQAIVAFRQSHGPFTQFDQLLGVRGIGPARLAAIQSNTTITDTTDETTQEGP